MRFYRGFFVYYPQDSSDLECIKRMPLKVHIFHRLLGGFIVLNFSGMMKGEPGIKAILPEAAGIIRYGEYGSIATACIIFTEDMELEE